LLVGVLLQQSKVGTGLFRSVLFLPTVVPVTMGFLMFQWILDPSNGILNYLLGDVLGLPSLQQNWLSDRKTVFGSLVAVTLWGFGPWILLLAGLLAIPKDLYEAARVDGAVPHQEFRYITLPQLRNTLMVVTTLQVIRALKIFVPIYVLTSGGPPMLANRCISWSSKKSAKTSWRMLQPLAGFLPLLSSFLPSLPVCCSAPARSVLSAPAATNARCRRRGVSAWLYEMPLCRA
jgi:ABC-type sugar transport system permease subunit